MTNKNTLSIVIPVHNEENNIVILFKEIIKVLRQHSIQAKILFVDDGSTDKTWGKIHTLSKKSSMIQGIKLRTRRGKAVALRIGFAHIRTTYVITMDGDLQDDPIEIPKFLKKLHAGFELVNGWKFHRKDPIDKTLPSKIFNAITSLLTGVQLHDMNCGYKGYAQELAHSLKLHGEMHRFIPVLAQAKGFSLTELKVHHRPRKYGKSKYSWSRFFYGFFDLLTVMYLIKFRTRPLHIFGFIGLTLLSFGTIISAYLSIDKLAFGVKIGDRPLLLLGVLLIIVGLQIVTFGLLGEQLTQLSDNEDYHDFIQSTTKKKHR